MTIKELFKNLSRYDENTRIDFILLDKEDWEDSTIVKYDTS